MEDIEDILNRDNTCFMDIDSQAIAALHNIDYDNSGRNTTSNNSLKKRSSQLTFLKPADKTKNSKQDTVTKPPSPQEPSISQMLNENSAFLLYQHEEFDFDNDRSKSKEQQVKPLIADSDLVMKAPESPVIPKLKSKGLFRTVDIASPIASSSKRSKNNKLSISAILDADNSILMDIDCEKVAALHNIDLNTPPPSKRNKEKEEEIFTDKLFANMSYQDDLANLTQCLIDAQESNEMILTQVKKCIQNYDEAAVNIVENHETSAVYVQRKDEQSETQKINVMKTTGNKDGTICGLSMQHKKFILQTKGIKDLYDWQYECLRLPTVRAKKNLIYALPTSGGKSLVAEILILRELLVHKKNAILLLPFVSIVQEKIQDFVPFALHYGFLVEEYCAGKGSIPPTQRREKKSLYVATTEKCQILIDSLIEANRIKEIGLVVVDELHMVGDKSRGHNLELLISKIMYLSTTIRTNIEIIGMSATIENLNDVAKFINADIYTRDFRPVELKEYIKMDDNLFYINKKAKSIEDTFKIERTDVGGDFDLARRQRDPDRISALVNETLSMKSSCLIFCSSKKSCENVALLLAETLSSDFRNQNREEKKNLIETIKMDAGGKICDVLKKTIPYGVTYHHSGLTTDERRRVEDAFRSGIINVICCTSTLAAGVNLPAGRVIIRSPNVGRDFMPLSTYKQMIGRAGRTGKSAIGDSILICNRKDYQKVVAMLTSKMDLTISNFITNPSLFRPMVLNLLASKLVNTFDGIETFTKYTFADVQAYNFNQDTIKCIKEVIQNLHNEGAIEHVHKSSSSQPILEFVNDGGIQVVIYADDELIISKLGQAAVNSGKSLEEAENVEEDLRKASEGLVLTQPLHLLYIIAPKDIITSINVNYRTFSELFFDMERIDKSIISTANAIGISMAQIARMMTSCVTYTEAQIYKFKRFYVAMMLISLWNGENVFEVSKRFKTDRGIVSKLMSSASVEAYSIFKFCEVFDEFWVYKEILETFSKRLQHCCSVELLPLMELPAIKIGRAKMLYAAGIKTIMDVAALSPEDLSREIKFINIQQATKVIRAAKYQIKQQFDDNREKLLIMKDVLNQKT